MMKPNFANYKEQPVVEHQVNYEKCTAAFYSEREEKNKRKCVEVGR